MKNVRPTSGPPWTAAEDRVLRRHYPTSGSAEVIRILAGRGIRRSPASVWRRAERLGVQFGSSPDLVPLVDAHHNSGTDRVRANRRIVAAAAADGVLVRSPVYPHTRLAPRAWVDAYIDALMVEVDEEREIIHDWLTSQEVASLFGLTPRSLYTITSVSCQKRYSIHQHLERIPSRTIKRAIDDQVRNGRYWERAAALREARLYNARRSHRRLRILRKRVAHEARSAA